MFLWEPAKVTGRKVSKGKLYDTSTSLFIYTCPSRKYSLYRTKKGVFFRMYRSGELMVLPEKDVRRMIELFHPVELYEQLFGKPELA